MLDRTSVLLHRELSLISLSHSRGALHFTILHSKDFKRRIGEFRDWPESKSKRLVDDLLDLVELKLLGGVATALERERYMSEYRAGGFPKKFRVESQFGICFHVCLTHVARAIVQSGLNPTLHVVVEAGHKNVGSAVTIFEGMKREWINKSGFPLLGDITIRNKAECPELMASDFLAHSYAALYRKKPLGENDGRPRAADTDFRGLRYVGLTEGALAQAKAEFAKRQEEQIAKWRAKRAEASFSLSSNSEAGQPHRQASKRQPSS